MHESEKVKVKSLMSCPTLHNPMDCSPPGSSIHGIFQARVLEWGAIAFSDVKVMGSQKSLGREDPLEVEAHWKYTGSPLQYSCLENPMDRGAWWAAVHGVVKRQT